MRHASIALLLSFLCLQQLVAQPPESTAILRTIVGHYYKTEKPIYKGRNQLLFFYCEKANNNEELVETINSLPLSTAESRYLKNKIANDTAPENWAAEFTEILASDKSSLKIKINDCLSLEQYQEKQKRFNLNNQRLMIVSKPLVYADGNTALVKVVFYRSIEHNNGSVLLMEKTGGQWKIKEFLSPWST